ncbi:OLC1v1030010C1 [Oldenlandia corymbosa var. corymbosa]|nr:OLC1v1030010C1 [Oldenlandia corymbosa var. corymbosa]
MNTNGPGNDSGAKEKVDSQGAGKQSGSKGTGFEDEKVDAKGGDQKSKDNGSKGTGNAKTGDSGSELKKPDGEESAQKGANDNGEKDGKIKDKASGGSSSESKDGTLVQGRKESGEACDSLSNSCSIDEKSIVACLRVPGNESPDLSLLIQNKGKRPVTVTISAPDFVKLQQKQIQVKENDNEKVMVTVGNGESDDSKIVLKAGNGNCMLDFKGMIAQSSLKRDPGFITQLSYVNLVKHSSSYVWFIPLAAILVIASVWIGVSFRRKYAATRNGSKYQKLEMELPVSSGVSKSSAPPPSSNDGWEDNWDDGWDDDDEEVAMPASSPVTSSLSSNGIAPRRIVKDGWKD